MTLFITKEEQVRKTGNRKFIYLLFLLSSLCVTPNLIFAISPLAVTVTLNKSHYISMDIVDIHGNLTYNGAPAKGLVGIQVNPYGQSPIVMRTVATGNTSSQEWGIEILSVQPCDQEGNPKQNFERGKWSYFKATVRNNEIWEQTVLTTINVYDSSLICIGLGIFDKAIMGGTTFTAKTSVWIPEWACVGNAPVYANVYTDWPENGGRPYSPEKMGNFTIIESEYEEPPDNPLPEQPIQNGSYEMHFCLGPEPFNATYLVSVGAYYQGYEASNSITFLVQSINFHNVAVTDIGPDAVYNNWVAKIAVTVKNIGTMFIRENLTVTTYVNDSLIGFETVNELDVNQQKRLTFQMDTTGISPLTNYIIRANVTILPDETNTTDNELIDLITVKLLGDVIFDRLIDISDVVSVTSIYRSKEGEPDWNPEVDLVIDGVIDIADVVTVTSIYRTTY
jgi:hypothetical protein